MSRLLTGDRTENASPNTQYHISGGREATMACPLVRTRPESRRRGEMGLLRAGCCRFLHPAEGDATPVRFPLEHCFDAFGPEAGDHTLHEREVRTAYEIVVLTRQGSEGAVAEDQAPVRPLSRR